MTEPTDRPVTPLADALPQMPESMRFIPTDGAPTPPRRLPGEEEIPWAMQFALRVEKSDPPNETDACEAAARACVQLIVLAEASGNAEAVDDAAAGWLDAVNAWRGVAIRKVVRRCRGKRWTDAQALPGVTVAQGNAEVRAFVPAPVRPLVPELAKMQVEGTDLEQAPSTSTDALVTIRISPLVTMTSGKSAAQCAHAAQRAYETMDVATRTAWAADDYRVRVVHDNAHGWASDPGQVSIIDAGFTELDGQHETVRANWG